MLKAATAGIKRKVIDKNLKDNRSAHGRNAPLLRVLAAVLVAGALMPAVVFAAPAAVVKMTDKPPMYKPQKVSIKVGQTVEWINNAETLHSVTTDPDSAQKPTDVSSPPGAKPFDSGFMKPGMTFDYTFTVPGKYKYLCLPHEKDGMVGYVMVSK
jgi:plastocyanin